MPGGLFWQDVPSINIVFARAAFSKHETFAQLNTYEATLLSSRMHHLMEHVSVAGSNVGWQQIEPDLCFHSFFGQQQGL